MFGRKTRRGFARPKFALALLLVGITVLGLLPGSTAYAVVGNTPGTFAVSPLGTATYTIPIWAPPGPHGLQPDIALVYNSGSGNGDVGVGWSLSGLGSIERCNQTYAQDGVTAPVTLTLTDTFCLNGQRLRLISGTYGEAGSTYATEVADFTYVTAYGVAGNGPAYFVVQDRSGRTYTYGNGSNSQVLASGTSTALAWLLDEVSDSAGNTMTVAYTTQVGTAVPSMVSWTPTSHGANTYAYTMTFAYGSNVAQSSVYGYVAGTSVENTDLLNSITVSYSGATVKKYVLSYQAAPSTGRDELVEVQECADSGATNCLAPTILTYQSGAQGLGSVTTLSTSTLQGFFSAYDLNGDGITDFVWYNGTTWEVSMGSPSGYSAPINTGITTISVAIEDIDGSGIDSFLVPQNSYWTVYKWNGSGFTQTAITAIVDKTTNASFALADVNGDGLPDLITTGTNNNLYVRLNTSAGGSISFSSTAIETTQSGYGLYLYSSFNGTRRLDFYGSGQQDLLAVAYLSRGTFSILHFNGTTFVPITIADNTADMADYNDDGCTDVLGATTLYISPCQGSVGTTVPLPGTAFGGIDWDSDGRRDLLVANGSTLEVYKSTGTGFASTPIATSIPYPESGYITIHNPTGDGQDGLLFWNSSIHYYLHNGAGQPPDLLSSVTDGYGNSANPTYVSIAQAGGSTFFPRTDATYPYQNYFGPTYVVSQTTFSDPSGQASTYQQQHYYSGAWNDLQGRGFSGFEAHQFLDSRNGVYETLSYDLAFPFTGMLVGDLKTENNSSATTISQLTNTITCVVLPSGAACPSETGSFNGRYFPSISSSTTQSYELGATSSSATSWVASTATSTAYDNYGNPLTVTTTVTDEDVNSPYYHQSWTTKTTNTPDTGTGVGCTSLLTETQVAYSASVDSPSVTQTKSFTPNLTLCNYTQIVTAPSNTTYQVTETFTYDAYGNINTDTVTGANMAARETQLNWGTSTGQFPLSVTDPTSASTQFAYNYSFGVRASTTDPNGLTTGWLYDGFGRKIQETRPDQTIVKWSYNDCSSGSGCPVGAHTLALTRGVYETDGATLETDGTTWFDPLQRSVLETKRVLENNTYSRSELHYDNLGRLLKCSAPCIFSTVSTPCPYMTTLAYDVEDRVISVTRPVSAANNTPDTTQFSYSGDTTVRTDPYNNATTKIKTPVGRLGRTQDNSGYYVAFSYDAYGSLTGATDKAGVVLATMTYDYGLKPFRRTLNDADLGNRSFTYDALGEVTGWSDANGNTFTETYDALSRPLQRNEPDLTTVWTWGSSATSHNIGKTQSVSANGYVDAYSYDSLSRLSDRTITIPSDTSYSYDLTYNSLTGFVNTLTYPTSTPSYRLELQYGYNNGILDKISDFNAPTTVFWVADTTNARGELTKETLGNGLVVNRSLDDVTGLLESIQAGVGGGTGVQNQSYLFDYVGNLIQRQDNNQGLTESIQYDDLYRIKQSTLNGTTNLSMTYNSMGGELTLQADGGPENTLNYTTQQTGCSYYANSQPHAPRSITNSTSGTISYCFDKNGNGISQLVSGAVVGTSTWTSYNQPSLMSDAYGNSSQFSYDGQHQRWKQVADSADGSSQTTTYVGGLLEKVLLPSGTTQYRHYIQAGSSTALYIRTASASSTYYITKDHLGSPNFTTGSTGTVVLAENFAALGYRRGANWTGSPTDLDYAEIQNTTQRGFTGQEMMDNLTSIDMNGRVNNALGQFYSPDPYVQNPSNTQSFNRYAYVLNNPLTFTDPSGFDCWDPTRTPDGAGGTWRPCPEPGTGNIPPYLTSSPPPTAGSGSNGNPGASFPGHNTEPRKRPPELPCGDDPSCTQVVQTPPYHNCDPVVASKGGVDCGPSKVSLPPICFGSFGFTGEELDGLGGDLFVGDIVESTVDGIDVGPLYELSLSSGEGVSAGVGVTQSFVNLDDTSTSVFLFGGGKVSLGPVSGTQAGFLTLTNGLGVYIEGHRGFWASGTGYALTSCPEGSK